ncbi:probable ATP-dependent RNA helicase DDX49 [Aphidius gifuensis]|uniref:probable ATP-dependent RNA helicase DDX49 n=1 Tax=Aphidius gifuensis TaxID=684658 RepID=UPI001CDD1573|nr:probable ATP-dependent RNA helicase DDX49 [Aphidius gifuensis]
MESDKVVSFEDLGINQTLVRQCAKIGITKPTSIQINCIPEILAGKDCIASAKTGSGKTLAFALPILQKFDENPYGIFALILTPTRELAIQIKQQFDILGKEMVLKTCLVIGGMDMMYQSIELDKCPHIVIATPGRLADRLESGPDTFTLMRIKFWVVDEADRLLGGDYNEQMKTIANYLPKKRQSLFFSATMTDILKILKTQTKNEAFEYEDKDDTSLATVKQLDQYCVLIPPGEVRDGYLVQVIRNFRNKNTTGSIVIFTDTCHNCQLISMTLNEIGFDNVALHGMKKQRERAAALTSFKSNIVKILVATGVAARGLDIQAVALVVNHVIPNVPKEYIHRVGRTARAGRSGQAISLVAPDEVNLVGAIEQIVGKKLEKMEVNDKEVLKIFKQVSLEKRKAKIELEESNFGEQKLKYKRKKLLEEGKSLEEIEEILGSKKRRKKEKNDDNLDKEIFQCKLSK